MAVHLFIHSAIPSFSHSFKASVGILYMLQTAWTTIRCPETVEAWTTLPSSAEVKNEWSYTSTYTFAFMAYAVTTLLLILIHTKAEILQRLIHSCFF